MSETIVATMGVEAFAPFPSISRLCRDMIVTEKIDGTNGCIWISPDGTRLKIGSRNRWIMPSDDNFGFARWACSHAEELFTLGPGTHYGEWWGSGIQRGYGLTNGEKRFSLFNVSRWADDAVRPACCSVVPVILRWTFDTRRVDDALEDLAEYGSQAAPGFMKPEGVVVYHVASGTLFKKTLDKNDGHKGQ